MRLHYVAFGFLVALSFTSCGVGRVSNPGKSRYTGYHGRQLVRARTSQQGESRSEKQGVSESITLASVAIQERKSKGDLVLFPFIWLLLSFLSLILFILALNGFYMGAAATVSYVLFGIVWGVNLIVLIWLIVVLATLPKPMPRGFKP